MNTESITPEWLAAQESFQNYHLLALPENATYWQKWLEEHPEHTETVAAAKRILDQLGGRIGPQEIAAEQSRFVQQLRQGRRLRTRRTFLRVAASFLFLLAGYWVWLIVQPLPTHTLTTAIGQLDTLLLPDGSLITLNSNSTLTYPEDWSANRRREVWVEGTAYFEIARDPSSPFVVHTELGDVEVLGTSFEVSDRENDFSVTLVEGSVQFRLPQQDIIRLKPSEQLRIKDGELSKLNVATEPIVAWRYDRMEFRNAPISEVIKQLYEDFGWTVEVKDKALLQRKITAKIPKNDPDLLLEALSVLYNLEIIKLEKNRYVIQ